MIIRDPIEDFQASVLDSIKYKDEYFCSSSLLHYTYGENKGPFHLFLKVNGLTFKRLEEADVVIITNDKPEQVERSKSWGRKWDEKDEKDDQDGTGEGSG